MNIKISKMALESSTLIFKYKTDKSDAELIKSLNLYNKHSHKIGDENVSYDDALKGTDTIYITSTDDFVIIVGLPLVMDFIYTNPYHEQFPNAEFFFMFNESVSMLNGYVYGKGNNIIRRKYVQDGKYFKSYDIYPDFGIPLIQEKDYYEFNEHKKDKKQLEDYMFGVYDYEISINFINDNFFTNPIEFLQKLVFNRSINLDLGSYISNSNEKVTTSDINNVFLGEIKKFMKQFKFKKINFSGKDQKIQKNSFYRQYEGFKMFLLVNKSLSFLPFNYSITIELDEKWVKNNLQEENYGIPIFSIHPSLYLKVTEKGNDYIYTRNDLELAFNSFESEFTLIQEIFSSSDLNKIKELFSNENFYNQIIIKIDKSSSITNKISYRNEINLCLLYYYFSKNIKKSSELIRLLDLYKNDSNKNLDFQTVPRKAIMTII